MPPSESGPVPYYHDGDYASGPPGEPAPEEPRAPRFSRGALDSVGQKIYDQLASQKAQLEQSLGPQEAAKYYTTLSGLTPDESLAMMASELRDTGITDIYKVKRETQQIPVRRDAGSGPGGEGGWESWDNYYDSQGNQIYDTNSIKQDSSGNYYLEKPQYVNTETGQPLVRSVGFGELSGRDDLLSDMAVGERQLTGTGIKFLDDGTPFYFSEGIQVPSGGFFRGLLSSPIGSIFATTALTTLLGPAGAGLSKIAAASVAGGLTGLARSDGDLSEALKGAALAGLTSYGLDQLAAPSFDITDVVPADAWFTGTPELVDELFTGNVGGGAAPTFDPSLASPELVNELVGGSLGAESFALDQIPSDLVIDSGVIAPPGLPSAAAGIEQLLSGDVLTPNEMISKIVSETAGASPDFVDDLFSGSGAPTPDVAYSDMFAPPGAGYDLGYALNEVNQPFTPETTEVPGLGTSPDWDTGYPSKPEVPEGSLGMDPSLGDPTAAPGGMPKIPMTPEETRAALLAGGTGDPYIASEMLGSPPSSWDPSFLAAAGAGIKALLNNPIGQFIVGKGLQSLFGGSPQGIQIPGGAGSGSGIAQPSVQYAQLPEFDVTKAFSPTLYAMRQQGAKS